MKELGEEIGLCVRRAMPDKSSFPLRYTCPSSRGGEPSQAMSYTAAVSHTCPDEPDRHHIGVRRYRCSGHRGVCPAGSEARTERAAQGNDLYAVRGTSQS